MKNVCFYLLRDGDSYQINVFNDSYNELKINGLEAHINLKNQKGTATQTLFIKYNPMFEGHRYELDYNPVLEEKRNGWGMALLHGYVGPHLTALGIPNLLNRFRQVALI